MRLTVAIAAQLTWLASAGTVRNAVVFIKAGLMSRLQIEDGLPLIFALLCLFNQSINQSISQALQSRRKVAVRSLCCKENRRQELL